MTSVQERLQLKREPLDKWSLREQLCLASAVARSGDQNWMSVSRALKPFGEANRPSDWFHQKNCAAQYGALLGNVETPKRKKRLGMESVVETPAECILRRLIADRQVELKQLLAEEKAEYRRVQDDLKLLQAGRVSEEQLDKWCKDIDEEEAKRELEAQNHAKWLKQRDLKKQEIERAWRPFKSSAPPVGQKHKMSEGTEEFIEANSQQDSQYQQYLTPGQAQFSYHVTPQQQQDIQQQVIQVQEPAKPALSPLLTSLLKSPSQVQSLTSVPPSILHSAITSQANNKLMEPICTSSPTITSLLNASSSAPVYSSTQNSSELVQEDSNHPLDTDLLDDANLKIDDLAKSILAQDGPFPEIKKEEVDDIISEIIENAHDIVADPEQHLQLDGNGDINISMELEDFESDTPPNGEELEKKEDVEEGKEAPEAPAPAPVVDPFEFKEDPVLFEAPVKPSSLKQEVIPQYIPLYQNSPIKPEEPGKKEPEAEAEEDPEKHHQGSVEIVEVVGEANENEKELDKDQICGIVHSSDSNKEEEVKEEIATKEEDEDTKSEKNSEEKPKESESAPSGDQCETVSDYADDLYDINMEVKIDKSGKAKRDYSRTKKKEEKSFDMLLAIEKAQLDDLGILDDLGTSQSGQVKSENDRSESPWTEEEDSKPSKRRYSVPGTPVDSLPNSPASVYDDDKDYRNWKKSVMLVYNRLASNKYASLFLKPINDDQAPGYSSMVYRPMDLQTLKKNIDNGTIRTSLEFKRDVMLMFMNAIMYNKTNDTVYNMALQMQQESMNPIEILLQAESKVDAPIRRETRTSESNCKRKRISEEVTKSKKRKDD